MHSGSCSRRARLQLCRKNVRKKSFLGPPARRAPSFRVLCERVGLHTFPSRASVHETCVRARLFSRRVKRTNKIPSLRRRARVPKTRVFRVLGWRSARSCFQQVRGPHHARFSRVGVEVWFSLAGTKSSEARTKIPVPRLLSIVQVYCREVTKSFCRSAFFSALKLASAP